jgi:hypothetical protein
MLDKFFTIKMGGKEINSYKNVEKAKTFIERFREIVSDPINILISRVEDAGVVDEKGMVSLHNGNRVSYSGENSYYNNFSDILVINRGVHEPLEEFCFQELLKKIKINDPVMLELGSYWAHYSMWFLQSKKWGVSYLVEPDSQKLQSGIFNFKTNGYSGNFINKSVGPIDPLHNEINDKQTKDLDFSVDSFFEEYGIKKLTILHSDIQGSEINMLSEAKKSLSSYSIDYLFISTHSQKIHNLCADILKSYGYIIEVSSDVDTQSTSLDGFILATSPDAEKIFNIFSPLGRLDILKASPKNILDVLVLNYEAVKND